jgi:hypothetical protein
MAVYLSRVDQGATIGMFGAVIGIVGIVVGLSHFLRSGRRDAT